MTTVSTILSNLAWSVTSSIIVMKVREYFLERAGEVADKVTDTTPMPDEQFQQAIEANHGKEVSTSFQKFLEAAREITGKDITAQSAWIPFLRLNKQYHDGKI